MTLKERLLRALHCEKVDRPPAAVPTQNAITTIMEKSGFRWPAAQKKATEMAGLAWACHEIGGIENVRVPFDINIEAEAMGCETRFGDDLSSPPVTRPKSRDEYDTLIIPDPRKDGRMPEVLEAISLLKQKTEDRIAVIAALGTPFELLSTSLSFEDITSSIYEDPGFLIAQMEKMTLIATAYGREIENREPDVLMLVDGTSQALGPNHYAQFSFPYTKLLAQALKKPKILHICGNTTPLLPQMAKTGVDAFSIDNPVDIKKARQIAGDKIALAGKISVQVLAEGSRQEVIAETADSVAQGMDIISPGCGILPQTPLENLRTYINYVVSSAERQEQEG